MTISKTDLVIDDVRNILGLEFNNQTCAICGYNHSEVRVEIETEEGAATVYLCENCDRLTTYNAKFGNKIKILSKEVVK